MPGPLPSRRCLLQGEGGNRRGGAGHPLKMQTIVQVIDEQEKALDALYRSHKSLLGLARTQAQQLAAQAADDDEWLRMPGAKQKCPILGCSHGTIRRHIKDKKIRRKRAVGTTFYSGADARRLLSETSVLP